MKRVAAIFAVIGLLVFMAPHPADAAPCDGLVCLDVANEEGLLGLDIPIVEDLVDALEETLQPVIEPIVPPPAAPVPPPPPPMAPAPTAPGPVALSAPVQPQAPAPFVPPAPVDEAAPIAPAPEAPAPVEQLPEPENNIPTGQDQDESATLSEDTTETNETAPPPEDSGGALDVIVPDDPEVAAVTGTILGLVVGLVAAFFLMLIAYKRGQENGAAEIMAQFEELRS